MANKKPAQLSSLRFYREIVNASLSSTVDAIWIHFHCVWVDLLQTLYVFENSRLNEYAQRIEVNEVATKKKIKKNCRNIIAEIMNS